MDIDKEIKKLKDYFDSYQGPYVDFRVETVILDGSFDMEDLNRIVSIMSAQQSVQPSNGDGTSEPANTIADDRDQDSQTESADTARHSVGG